MLDVSATLNNMQDRMEELDGKTMAPKDWVQELAGQVLMLIKLCKQQQEEIDRLKIKNVLW